MTRLTMRHVPGLLAGPAVFAAFVLVPPSAPITELGMARFGLLSFAVVWWLATPLPLSMTTLAALALGLASGALSATDAFAHSSSWVLWFVVGTFGLAAAFESTGVNRRLALAFLDAPWARGRSDRFLMMFLTSATLMSTIMANTVVAVVWLALALKIYRLLELKTDDPAVEANTLGIAWAANFGGVATPIGNGTNIAAMAMIASATGVTISFLEWTAIGAVLTVMFLASALLVFRFTVASGAGDAFGRPEAAAFIAAERAAIGPQTPRERWAMAWVGLAILLWFIPDLAGLILDEASSRALRQILHMSVPALLVPILMCLMPVPGASGERVLTWDDWMRAVDWPLVLFIGGVMGIGTAVGTDATGLPQWVKAVLEPALSGMSETAFVTLMCAGVVLVTSLISNMVTLAIFVPLGMAMATGLGVADPVALGVVLGMGPSLDYLLPSGTTTNAIVVGSGYLRVRTMIRYGLVLFVVHTLILAWLGYPLAKFVLGR